MRRFLFILFLLLAMIVSPAQAQLDQTVDQLVVKIWPEYDRPSVLVILDLFLSSDVKMPAKVSVRIPASAGAPHSVAVRELDGQLYVIEYESEISGEWNTLTFTTPFPEVWIEYYDPSIIKDGDVRSFAFRWAGDLAVQMFNIEVQQPLTAGNMTFKENMGAGRLASDGLTYFSSSLGAVEAGTPFTLNMQYTKSDDTLTSSNSMPVQAVQPVTEQTSGRQPFSSLLPYLLGGLGLILLALGLFWYLQSRRNPSLARAAARSGGRKRHSTASYSEDSIYCHQCGKRAAEGDIFCRVCGTKLKVE